MTSWVGFSDSKWQLCHSDIFHVSRYHIFKRSRDFAGGVCIFCIFYICHVTKWLKGHVTCWMLSPTFCHLKEDVIIPISIPILIPISMFANYQYSASTMCIWFLLLFFKSLQNKDQISIFKFIIRLPNIWWLFSWIKILQFIR